MEGTASSRNGILQLAQEVPEEQGSGWDALNNWIRNNINTADMPGVRDWLDARQDVKQAEQEGLPPVRPSMI